MYEFCFVSNLPILYLMYQFCILCINFVSYIPIGLTSIRHMYIYIHIWPLSSLYSYICGKLMGLEELIYGWWVEHGT